MKTAYDHLDVAETATDDDIRKAYLLKIQQFPPDRHPEQFQVIRDAYEAVSTVRNRARYRLFHVPDVDINALFAPALTAGTPRRPSVEQFLKCLKASL